MMRMLRREMDVAEVYGPPRVVVMPQKMGLRAGWSLDLTTQDENGRVWGPNRMRNKAIRELIQGKPRLLIGSPICTPCS